MLLLRLAEIIFVGHEVRGVGRERWFVVKNNESGLIKLQSPTTPCWTQHVPALRRSEDCRFKRRVNRAVLNPLTNSTRHSSDSSWPSYCSLTHSITQYVLAALGIQWLVPKPASRSDHKRHLRIYLTCATELTPACPSPAANARRGEVSACAVTADLFIVAHLGIDNDNVHPRHRSLKPAP